MRIPTLTYSTRTTVYHRNYYSYSPQQLGCKFKEDVRVNTI